MRRALALSVLIAAASAYPTYQARIPNGANVQCDNCDDEGGSAWPGVGHFARGGGGPRNPFGLAFAAVDFKWTKSLCQADTDGDGQTNGFELGDPNCVWVSSQPPQTPSRTEDISHPGFSQSKSTAATPPPAAPLPINDPPTALPSVSCVAYSEDACAKAARAQGLELGGDGYNFRGEWLTKGCHYYPSDKVGGTHAWAGRAFYGTIGGDALTSAEELGTLGWGQERVLGHDCSWLTNIENPPVAQSYETADGPVWHLEFGAATFRHLGNLSTRAYKDGLKSRAVYSIPGPLFRMRRGVHNKIVLHNALEPEPSSVMPLLENGFRDPMITNLHTHGLHIHGDIPGDDVMTRQVDGGECLRYTYELPAEHMGGTFFYHPHHHGSTALQVSGGAAGMLIVADDPVADGIPTPVQNMEEILLAVQYIDPDAATKYTAPSHRDSILRSDEGPLWVVNGLPCADDANCGVVKVRSDEWYRFRILLAHPDATTARLQFPTACELQHLASDGVWRRSVPRALAGGSPPPGGEACDSPGTCWHMTGASRVDLAVRCPAALGTAGRVTVQRQEEEAPTLVAVMHVTTAASAFRTNPDNVGPWAVGGVKWTPTFPAYLSDISDESTPVDHVATPIDVSKLHFNHSLPLFELEGGQVHAWPIIAQSHPWHMHVVHFMVVAGNCGIHEVGEYIDTLAAGSTGAPCIVRFKTSSHAGRQVHHCHRLGHEDNGMMGWNRIAASNGNTMPRASTSAARPYRALHGFCTEVAETVLSGGDDPDAMDLDACTGRCNSDAQCKPGLECFAREGGEQIPGCSGDGGGADWDYCYVPTVAPFSRVDGDCVHEVTDQIANLGAYPLDQCQDECTRRGDCQSIYMHCGVECVLLRVPCTQTLSSGCGSYVFRHLPALTPPPTTACADDNNWRGGMGWWGGCCTTCADFAEGIALGWVDKAAYCQPGHDEYTHCRSTCGLCGTL